MAINIPKRYTFTGKEFSGGMSRTRQYKDTHLDRLVMIKEVADSEAASRVLDEITALQRIRSKHVVEVYDLIVGEAASEIAIVEEFVEGSNIQDLASRGPFETSNLLTMFYQVADSIAEVHAQGVVHRDISASNIKVDSAGYLKLFDFGLARLDNVNSSTTGYVGTPGYSAPELYAQGKVYFSKPADIFALGAVAWTLAVGRVPEWLKERSLGQAVDAQSIGTVVGLPSGVIDLIDRAIHPHPDERPTAEAVAAAISRELLRGQHRATLFYGARSVTIDANTTAARIGAQAGDNLVVKYDGYDFLVVDCQGDVFVNNDQCAPGRVIDGACLIALGAQTLGKSRTFVTIDVSSPEVTIRGIYVA